MSAFRDNEVSRVSAVLEAKLQGDVPGAIAAAASLWITAREDQTAPDLAAAETWQALGDLGAIDAAVQAATTLVRERKRLRSHVFVDLVEHTTDLETLLELLGIAVAAGWNAETYRAALFARLLELQHFKPLERFIDANRSALHADPQAWILVGFTVTVSPVGNNRTVDEWFKGWQQREGGPMWLLVAFAGTFTARGTRGGSCSRSLPRRWREPSPTPPRPSSTPASASTS